MLPRHLDIHPRQTLTPTLPSSFVQLRSGRTGCSRAPVLLPSASCEMTTRPGCVCCLSQLDLIVFSVFSVSFAVASGLLMAIVANCHDATQNARPGAAHIQLSPTQRAQFSFQPFELTDVCFACTRPNATVLFACNVQFDWFDPNSVKENNVTSCSCSYSWHWDGQAAANGANNTYDAVDFLVCSNHHSSLFEMRVNFFSDPTNLTLFMSHYYKDSSLWGAPYLYVQTWAMPILNLTRESRDNESMRYFKAGPILANITGLDG
ncbi:hypothetical protein CMQ_7309 [Grosmannia clavigera kw1407]|uniref:Uncharacterized protein n=1 Tax=Grosmannia clavigera (strain kw1407 / UAMH 11150) TaxID=655863 RepID=F0XPM3_GROCL|nr:uncharacterized protein CMQ_7309 [Grosmannia clavigera kw1407]EFX00307.1 hypothetical protein CMQ_7309 [Grosmannia clavigera kw1407]